MKLEDCLNHIRPIKGITSVIDAFLSGDFNPVSDIEVTSNLKKMQTELSEVKEAQENCQSDGAYWGYQGQKSYLQSIVYLLKAAKLVGKDHLPYVRYPKLDGLVMDSCYDMEKFGQDVYEKAKLKAKKGKSYS